MKRRIAILLGLLLLLALAGAVAAPSVWSDAGTGNPVAVYVLEAQLSCKGLVGWTSGNASGGGYRLEPVLLRSPAGTCCCGGPLYLPMLEK